MVEIPECYVLAEQLEQALQGKIIANVIANHDPHKFAWYTGNPNNYGQWLLDKPFVRATPGTAYTCGGSNVEIQFGDRLLVISTPIRFHAVGESLPKKHQLLVEFTDDTAISCTVQMWGSLFLLDINNLQIPNGYKVSKGPSPLEDAFDQTYFDTLLHGENLSKCSAKAFLATEQRIPGLGNGVIQDILFRCAIHPKRKLSTLSDGEWKQLFHSIKNTLKEMTMLGGRDTERDLFGCPGGYRTILSKKTAELPCPICGASIIREAYLGGNIYFCSNCQPL